MANLSNGKIATTAPFGNIHEAFDIVQLAQGAGATFVARTSAYHVYSMTKIIEKAIQHKGFSGTIRPGGLLLIDNHFVKAKRNVDARQTALGMYKAVMETIKEPIVFNICVLGVLLGLTDMIKPESVIKVLETKVPVDYLDLNKKAFDLGLKLSKTDKTDGLGGNP